MRQTSSTMHSSHHTRSQAAAAEDEQNMLMRGLVHGVILSIAVWTAGLYVLLVWG